ncbi:hypothetical protein [Novosphingobium sp. AP12]|uniref:hypothetical protein n=1 Tax=Novosphingobium sp. AP12 TaxID=1144305 RepID=UPI00068B684E|nr:hypothetical protein [Novosphingobium sp. AP12]
MAAKALGYRSIEDATDYRNSSKQDREFADMCEWFSLHRMRHQAPRVPAAARWRHKKRGTEYEVVAVGELQMSSNMLVDGSSVVIYRGDDDRHWVRCEDEFHDGRFEKVETT